MAMCVSIPNILWKIENFSSAGKKLSPTLRFLGMKFNLSTYQFMESGNAKLQLILECQTAFQELPPYEFNTEVSILRNNCIRNLVKTGNYTLGHNQWCIWTDFVSTIHKTLGQIKYITFLILIMPSGTFETLFHMKESDKEAEYVSPCSISLGADIGNLFNDAERSDFTLKCGNKRFFAHKAILSARSEYFAGMFRSDMKETNDKEGAVENIEPHVLEMVLRYLYTGKIKQLPMGSLRKVYTAADRLIVEPLKLKCQALLVDNLTSEYLEDGEKEMENEESELGGSDEEANDIKQRQMLKDLLMTREWRLFSQEFPEKSHEMCKVFLL